MFSFLKPKLDFSELPNKERFEKILEKYIAPKLLELGFTWIKELRLEQDVLDSMSAELRRPLAEHEEVLPHEFERKRGEILDRIIFKRKEINGRLTFYSDCEIAYIPYEDWHAKTYDEAPWIYSVFSWSDWNDERIGKKFRKKMVSAYRYDLSRYSTNALMDHVLKQVLTIRISDLERFNTMKDIIAELKSLKKPGSYEVLFDFYIMAGDFVKAGKTLIWAENVLSERNPYFDSDDDFWLRLTLLNKNTSKIEDKDFKERLKLFNEGLSDPPY